MSIDDILPVHSNGIGSPAVGAQNNFDLAALLANGFGAGRLGVLSFSGAATTLTGIARPSVIDANYNNDADQPYSVIFLSHPNVCTLTPDSVASSVGNRIAAGGPASVTQAILIYDYTVSKWRVIASVGPSSSLLTQAGNDHAAAGTALTDADEAAVLVSAGYWRTCATLSAARVKTISATGAVAGDVMTITRTSVDAFTLEIVNGGAGAGSLITLPASKRGFADIQFDGHDWALKRCAPN